MTNENGVATSSDVPGVHRFIQIPVGWNSLGNVGKVAKMISFGRKIKRGNWIAQGEEPDVVIGSSPSLHAALGASELANRYGVPFILEIRDLWPLSLVEVAGVSPNNPLVKWMYKLEREVVSRATRIISLLPHAHLYLEKYAVDPSTVDWVPNGVEKNLFANEKPKEVKDEIFGVVCRISWVTQRTSNDH